MWEGIKNYLPVDKCKDGYLYKVLGRNLSLGIYSEKKKGFIYVRYKFGDEFLDDEKHWDVEDRGTCKPIEELGYLADLADLSDSTEKYNLVFELLKKKMEEYKNDMEGWKIKMWESQKPSETP